MILHAGTHKTGTTSIQKALDQNRHWLQERGYAYPQLGRLHHHNELAHRLALNGQGHVDVRSILGQVSGHTLVLSGEEFWGITRRDEDWNEYCRPDYWQRRVEYLKRVRAALCDFEEITVLICFRCQDEFAASLYATKLLNGRFRGSFGDFRSRSKPLFDYRGQLDAFRAVFDIVRFTSFDALRNNLVPAFCNWAGIPVPPRGLARREKVTPAEGLVRWVDKRRAEADSEDLNKQRIAFAKSNYAATALADIGNGSFWSSDLERRSFLNACSDPEPGFFPSANETMSNAPDQRRKNTTDFSRIDHAFNAWRLARQRRPIPQDVS